MPRLYNSTFQPFTYDELATPLREATEAHQAQELAFDTLMTDADKMKAFLNEDWQSYKDYSEYVNQLNVAAEDLAKNGLTRQNRGSLLLLKRDYNGKIQAINAGILSRLNAIDNFNKSAKGQSSRYIGPRPDDYSVDEYMYGNNPFKPGVDGGEIYSYADELAKASTSRRYQEFTDGGRWRITEVGVDANTTSMIMDALMTGKNFTDPEYALLARNNPRQFEYMQAVLDDMRDIAGTARETFGYGEFGSLNDNGDENWVRTTNQKRFDSEILGGINHGIQYKRNSEADPYAKMDYQHRLNEIEADNDLNRWIVKQGLEAGTLAYDPVSKTIIPVDNSTQQSIDLSVPLNFGVITRPYAMTNPNTMDIFNELGYKDIKIDLDENGNPIVTGFNDINNENGGVGFTYNNEKQFFNNRVDFTTFVKYNQDQLDYVKRLIKNQMSLIEDIISDNYDMPTIGGAKSVLNSMSKQEFISKYGRRDGYNWSDLYDKYYELKYDLESITEKGGLQDLINRIKKDNKQYILSDKQYNKLKEAMYIDSDYMTMDQLQESYLYNPSTRSNWDDEEYSLISQSGVKNSSNVFRDELLNSLKSAFVGEGTVTEYEDLGNDVYEKVKNPSKAKDYFYLDKNSETGIIEHINDITVTKGSLMNDTPLIKIYYTGEDGELVKIIPITRLNNNNVILKIRTLTNDIHGLYRNVNINNVNDRVALSNLIKYNIANLQ